MLDPDQVITLLFVPCGMMLVASHLAIRKFRAHFRRRHPDAYREVYGALLAGRAAGGGRFIARMLRLRFEWSSAYGVLGDRELDALGRRLRWCTLAAVMLFSTVLGVVAGQLTAVRLPPAYGRHVAAPAQPGSASPQLMRRAVNGSMNGDR